MSKNDENIQKVSKQLIGNWLNSRHLQKRLDAGKVGEHVGPYLVISRETGALGSEIAQSVGKRMGWQVLDGGILDHLAETYHTPRQLLEFVDEKKANWLNEIFTGFLADQQLTSTMYVHRLSKMLLLAAHHGEIVVVGRGAQYILPRGKGLVVRILAPFPFRVKQIMMRRGLTRSEAELFVHTSDEERQGFVKQYFHNKVSDPHLHDLVINVEKLGIEGAVPTIITALQSWLKIGVI